jgi:hypothetical protein
MQQEDANRKDGWESIAAPFTRTVIPPVTLGVLLADCILIGAFLRIDGLGVKTF